MISEYIQEALFFIRDNAKCTIGSGYMNVDSRIQCFQQITIGEDVAISERVTIRDSDNHQIVNYPHQMSAPILIGNHVWIGMGAMILKGGNNWRWCDYWSRFYCYS